jgi:hypothetical protein
VSSQLSPQEATPIAIRPIAAYLNILFFISVNAFN